MSSHNFMFTLQTPLQVPGPFTLTESEHFQMNRGSHCEQNERFISNSGLFRAIVIKRFDIAGGEFSTMHKQSNRSK